MSQADAISNTPHPGASTPSDATGDATTAADIMSVRLITVQPTTRVEDAIRLMVNHKITGLPVVDPDGALVGVVSEYDLLAQLAGRDRDASVFGETIRYSTSLETLRAETPLEQIVERFINSRVRRMPVLDADGRLAGIITRRDLMKIYYYRMRLAEL